MTALLAGCSGKQDARTVELSEAKEGSVAEEKEEETEESAIEENEEIYVHVCGKVNQPGVYCLPAGSRLYEAIEAAGGLKEGAAAESLNQAQEGPGRTADLRSFHRRGVRGRSIRSGSTG